MTTPFPAIRPALRRRLAAGLGAAALLLAGAAAAPAQEAAAQPQAAGKRTPLLIPGKTTLFQRVLTRPGAQLAAQPGGPAGKSLPPLSVMYVYGQQEQGEASYVEVGPDSQGTTAGWVRIQDTIPWRHSLVLAFNNPANRDRVLFFRDQPSLTGLLQSDQLLAQSEEWRRQIVKGALPPGSPVVSIEPETFIDLQKQFYLLPILEAETKPLPSGFRVRTVKIASVTKETADAATAVPQPQAQTQPAPPQAAQPQVLQRGNMDDALAKFRSGVVFVIDATSSMQPYIDRTRQAVDAVYREIESAKLDSRVRFGLVAYRDDPGKVKGLEYLARMFADPSATASRDAFMQQVKDLRATPISTRAFAEDGYAGLEQAIRGIDWKGFGGRYIIMVTDASSREGSSPLASTGLSTDQIRQLAEANGIALYILHLKTAEGRNDHAAARAQYERLSHFPGVGSLYFPVDAGDQEVFRSQVEKLAQSLVAQVRDAGKSDPTAPPPAPATAAPAAAPAAAADRLQQTAEAVGRAMRLAYLGTVQGTKAPPMFEAWASDRDFRRPDLAAFSVRLLLTKNQLSDLQATLRRVVDAGEKGQIEPEDFFNQLRSAAAAMGRDPSRIAQGPARNLEEVGLMGEYLDGLPYQSKIMGIDPDSWTRMSVGEQQTLIDEIKSKVALYQRFHDDVDRWVPLSDGSAAGDAVYPVPIDSLP